MINFGKFPQYFFEHRSSLWQATIGLEIHAQLKLKTKLFSPGSTSSQKNTGLGLFDIALPGTLPQLNKRAVEEAIKTAIALKCDINLMSHFDRKHYFYLDLPLGFQITQQGRPLGSNGSLSFRCSDGGGEPTVMRVKVQRLQIEQDSAKSIHDMDDQYSLIDFCRAGAALVEIVFAPTLRTPRQASSVLVATQQLLRHIDVCTGNLEDGSMRCDVNVSVARFESTGDFGQPQLLTQGDRVEVKNLSSLQRVETAAAFEIERHVDLLLAGEHIPRETRGFNAASGSTFSLRTKESAVDYRFSPDPDLPPLLILPEELEQYRMNMPELPSDTISRMQADYGLNDYQISVLFSLHILWLYEGVMKLMNGDQKRKLASLAFNWISSDLAGVASFNQLPVDQFPISVQQAFDIIINIDEEKLTSSQIKKLLISLYEDESLRLLDVSDIVANLNLVKVSDQNELTALCISAINDSKNGNQLAKYRSGKHGMFNFFFGEVMKSCKGQADPAVVRVILDELLNEKTTES